MNDMTYCNSQCKFAQNCERHYTHHLVAPSKCIWTGEFRTSGSPDKTCVWYIKKEEKTK